MDGELDRAEFQALRDTIRERGTRRVTVFWATTAFWATLLMAAIGLVAFAPTIGPRAGAFLTLVSLLPLAAGFEAVFALHVGVERIGRYLQVFYEGREPLPAWERTAMAIGPSLPKGQPDPLFSAMFAAAGVLNLAPALLSRRPALTLAALVAHGLFGLRLFRARRFAARQRGEDLGRFEQIRDGLGGARKGQEGSSSNRTAH